MGSNIRNTTILKNHTSLNNWSIFSSFCIFYVVPYNGFLPFCSIIGIIQFIAHCQGVYVTQSTTLIATESLPFPFPAIATLSCREAWKEKLGCGVLVVKWVL